MICKVCRKEMEYGSDSSPGGPYGDETIFSYFYACHNCKYHIESRKNVGGGFGSSSDGRVSSFKREPYNYTYWMLNRQK